MNWIAHNRMTVPARTKHTAWSVMIAALCFIIICLAFAAPASAQFGEVIAFESPGDTTYYLDADTGNDERSGTRPHMAWETLSRVNSTRFAAGDKLLIRAGTTYHGRLWPKGTGRPGVPITIDSYGDGPRPAIHAEGKTSEALLLENTQAWHISNLELTNTGDKPEAFRFGLSITVEDMGSAGDFELINLFIHDVNGATEPGLGEGAGIIWRNRGSNVPTRFEGLLVENCIVTDCGRNGILGLNNFAGRGRRLANVDIVIRENEVSSTPGDGIRLTGCTNAVVEYNRVQKAGGIEDGLAGGIVLIGCDTSLVQYNEIEQTQGTDNAALVCDTNSRYNTFQFNYTHGNTGPMAAIRCHAPTPIDAGNLHTAIRYNISQDDGGAVWLTGPVSEAQLHNNTLYTGQDSDTVSIKLIDLTGPPTVTTLANNVFYTLGQASLDLGQDPEIQIHHNAYFGLFTRPEDETGAVTGDPLLTDPGLGKAMKDGLGGYQTLSGSPLRGAGVRLKSHGNHDFWANPVPGGTTVDIGAHQAPSDNVVQPTQPASNAE
jgi:hypothetical protein